jgi:hypothetical protein
VCKFSEPPGKQPFEQIVFGYRKGGNRKQPLPEPDRVIVSVPSAVHSHKPPLSGEHIIQIWLDIEGSADTHSACSS